MDKVQRPIDSGENRAESKEKHYRREDESIHDHGHGKYDAIKIWERRGVTYPPLCLMWKSSPVHLLGSAVAAQYRHLRASLLKSQLRRGSAA
jgi:hypothetical protein